jgi:stage V sporulation protein G
MEITEVRVHLRNRDEKEGKLKAFVTVTFDNAFVVRDLKVIDGKKGLFVAMPSIKVTEICPQCRKKNPLRNKYCGECGTSLAGVVKWESEEGRREEHRDIAHPINAEMRDYIQKIVLDAFEGELKNPTAQPDAEEHLD